tara:strand:+ start:117 stop:914 length:798 start_codon:yes stop_codon:yes gene_type:complete
MYSKNIDDYKLLQKIGSGAFSYIYKGTYNEKVVAIKKIDKRKVNQNIISSEIEIFGKLTEINPHIIELYEFIDNNDFLYIIMEYIEGDDLYNYFNRYSPLSEHEIENIFNQIIISVLYCHNILLAHRDIKLENFMIDKNNRVVLIDFGFSTSSQIRQFTIQGTAHYVAPELYSIKTSGYDSKKIDMWALGTLLYILMYGKYPFKGRHSNEIPTRLTEYDKQFYLTDKVYYPYYGKNDKIKKSISGLICADEEKRLSIDKLYNIWY